jgi:RNA polymerase sporulation-specific sigma factor
MTRQEALIAKSQAGDMDARESLVTENAGLIWSIARRFMGRGIDPDDLYQLGCLGFLKAVDGFDFAYGTQFSTYAVPKIMGEIRRYLRDDGAIKVSRILKERAYAVRRAREDLIRETGCEPRISELVKFTGLSIEEIAECEQAVLPPESFQQENGESGLALEGTVGAESFEDSIIDSVALSDAIKTLCERDKQLISLRYFHNLTQQATAKLLNISQVQVSRLEKKIIAQLRESFFQ